MRVSLIMRSSWLSMAGRLHPTSERTERNACSAGSVVMCDSKKGTLLNTSQSTIWPPEVV